MSRYNIAMAVMALIQVAMILLRPAPEKKAMHHPEDCPVEGATISSPRKSDVDPEGPLFGPDDDPASAWTDEQASYPVSGSDHGSAGDDRGSTMPRDEDGNPTTDHGARGTAP